MTNLRQAQLNQQRATTHHTTAGIFTTATHSLAHTHTHSENKYADLTHSFAAGAAVATAASN